MIHFEGIGEQIGMMRRCREGQAGETESSAVANGDGERGRESGENLVKSTRVEKRDRTRRVLRYAPGLCKYHSAVI